MRTVFKLLAVLAVVTALVACAGTDDADMADDPTGRTWQLTDLEGSAPLEGTTLDMTIENEEVHGSSGCNTYNGPATVDNGSITLGPDFAVTFMACEDAIMEQEQKYLDVLSRATTYVVEGPDELVLQDADGIELAKFE